MKNKPANTFTATEVGALMEELKTQIGAVAEGQMALRDSMEGVKDKVDGLGNKVDVLGVKVDVLGTKVAKVETILKSHDERLFRVEEIIAK